jgi:hypothetical protein
VDMSFEASWFANFMTKCPVSAGSTHSADYLERLLQLFLEILQDPQGASDLMLSGVWQCIGCVAPFGTLDPGRLSRV